MTKRPSPFEPNICRQTKIHFNNLENDIMALKQVEELTLKKLLNGSKKLHSIILNKNDDFHPGNGICQPNNNFMQMCVTNYVTVNGRKINEGNRVLITPFEAPNKCSFCETKINSVYQCALCSDFFCCACSFNNYESSEDKRICLSCS